MAAKKVDANQPEIVDTLRRCGVHVLHLHTVGKGCPDILCTAYHRGYDCHMALLVEIKTETGKLNAAERKFFEEFPGPAIVARRAEDVLDWFEA